MKNSGCLRIVSAIVILSILLMAAYPAFIRPWSLRWGATNAELAAPLPGDDLIANPERVVTRAITIEAPAPQVWAWVAQSGADKGGLYSYTALESLIACPIVNADRIHPEWQNPQAGDMWAMCPGGSGPPPYVTALVEPGHALVLGHREASSWFDTWAFVVEPVDADTTRLIHRSRTAVDETWVKAIEPAMFTMERGMMRGIRARAEGWTVDPSTEDPYRLIFLALFAAYLAIRWFYQRRRPQQKPLATAEGAGLQTALLWLATLASIPPVLYALSELVDFAHLPLPGIVRILGALLFMGGDVLFYAAHRSLKENWSAQVEIQADHELVTSGPYNRVRHPMYTALFLVGGGMLLLSANWLVGAPFLIVFTALYLTRVESEERLLHEHFGTAYKDYVARTGRLLPRF